MGYLVKCNTKTNALSQCSLKKFREVSDTVWVSFEAVITEKTIKEERTNNNNYYDNYNLVYSDTMNIEFNFEHFDDNYN